LKFTAIINDGVVGVDGVFRTIDLTGLSGVHAIQWNGTSGHVENNDGTVTNITSLAPYQSYINAWNALTPPPPIPPTQAELDAIALAQAQAQAKALAEKNNADAVKADATVQFILTHTGAEVSAFIGTNVTNLATAVNMLQKMGLVLSVLVKKELG
jgi:hypothetical protein